MPKCVTKFINILIFLLCLHKQRKICRKRYVLNYITMEQFRPLLNEFLYETYMKDEDFHLYNNMLKKFL